MDRHTKFRQAAGLVLLWPIATRAPGYVDRQGKVVFTLPDRWKLCGNFCDGRAWVLDADDRYGYIDTSGNLVIDHSFRSARDFAEGLAAAAEKKGRVGFIDRSGEFVIPPKYSEVGPFRAGLAPVRINGKWGYVDQNGETVWEPSK